MSSKSAPVSSPTTSDPPGGGGGSSSSAIVVGVRVRPFNQREIKYGSKCIISMEGGCTRVAVVREGKLMMEQPKEFFFDHAFWTHSKTGVADDSSAVVSPAPYADQETVYRCLGKSILQNVIDGFNSCLFAYGQTGSGKTYSMMGTGSDPGVLPRIGAELFEKLESMRAAGGVASVECSFCEIYNEKVRDLMEVPAAGEPSYLAIRQHPKLGVFVQGLQKFAVKSAAEFCQMLDTALSQRAVASTNMNAQSSRSHALVLVTIAQKDTRGVEKAGRMSLVDLAGSERSASTGAVGATAQEGNNINLSLSTLGLVLSRLAEKAEGKGAGLHIPYRDSALTFLLSENLGGNSKTAMLANISPASLNFDETISTLRFASITKKVRTVAVVNENPQTKMIRELKEELERLRQQWQAMQGGTLSEDILREMRDNELAIADIDAAPMAFEQSAAFHQDGGGGVSSSFAGVGGLSTSFAGAAAGTGAGSASTAAGGGGSSFAGGIFLDWHAPQLINLAPDAPSAVAAVHIREGTNQFKVDGEQLSVHFDGLANQVTIFGSEIYLNGERVPDEGAVLRHQDRIIIGKRNAFRFAHASGLGKFCDFQREPTCEDHLLLLERYGRNSIIEERSKDAMAIGKAYFASSAALSAAAAPPKEPPITPLMSPSSSRNNRSGGGGGDAYNDDDDGAAPSTSSTRRGARGRRDSVGMGSLITPRSTNPLLAEIGDQISWSNQTVFRIERDLADAYPATAPDAELLQAAEAVPATAAEALEELGQALREGEAMIERLRSQLNETAQETTAAIASAMRIEAEVDDVSPHTADELRRAEEVRYQATIDEQVTARAVSRNLKWHTRVKQLRKFRVEGPQDPIDNATWQRLLSNPPFLADATLSQVRNAAVHFIDPANGVIAWESRYIAASKRFLFLFRRADGRERCHCAVYLLGATVSTSIEDGRFVLDVTPACPRSTHDPSVSGVQAQVRLAFGTAMESYEWRKWIESVAVPPAPALLRKAALKEMLSITVEPTTTVMVHAPMAKLGGRQNWKPDSEATHCAGCNAQFMPIFRRRHHCRTCGGVFCAASTCMKNKICTNCSNTYERESSYVEVETRKHTAMRVRPRDLPGGDFFLVQDFFVRVGRREVDEILFRVDLYRNRAHTCLADEIRNVERCPRDPALLVLHLRDNTAQQLHFRNAREREQAFEAITALIGHRMYLPRVAKVAAETDLLVEDGTGLDAMILATSSVSADAHVWVGQEDGRTVPFFGDYGIWVLVGHQETWSDETLKQYRLTMVARVPLHKTSALYVIATEDWASRFIRATPSPVHIRGDKKICAVGLQILETSLLCIAVETVYDQPAVSASDADGAVGWSLDFTGVTLMDGLPAVDPMQLYDHTIVVGMLPDHIGDFQTVTVSKNVHVRSAAMAAATVRRAERTTALLEVPVMNPQVSFAGRDERLLVQLRSVRTDDGVAEIAQPCQLWASVGFDRVDRVESPGAGGGPARPIILPTPERGAGQLAQGERNPFASLLFANSEPECISAQNMFLVVPEMGTGCIPIASFAGMATESGEELTVPCDVGAGGVVHATLLVTLRCQWVRESTKRRGGAGLNDFATPDKGK